VYVVAIIIVVTMLKKASLSKRKTLRSLTSKEKLSLILLVVEEEVVKSTTSPFPPFPLLLIPYPFFASSEAPKASYKVLSIALGNLSWFNLSSRYSSTANGPFVASMCRPQPQIHHLLEVLRFVFFKIRFVHFRELYHHTHHSTLIWAFFAPRCHQPFPRPGTMCLLVDLTHGCVSHTRRHVDTVEPRVVASTDFHSCH